MHVIVTVFPQGYLYPWISFSWHGPFLLQIAFFLFYITCRFPQMFDNPRLFMCKGGPLRLTGSSEHTGGAAYCGLHSREMTVLFNWEPYGVSLFRYLSQADRESFFESTPPLLPGKSMQSYQHCGSCVGEAGRSCSVGVSVFRIYMIVNAILANVEFLP